MTISSRLARIFLPDAQGRTACDGGDPRYERDPAWKDLVLFYAYFHGDTGRGVGASHQTGRTALATRCIEKLVEHRMRTARVTTQQTKVPVDL